MRAPISRRPDANDGFKTQQAQLTATGMRQRYLLGRYMRKRYVEDHKLISDHYVPGEVFIQSTSFYRTMQSAYSEQTGIFYSKPETHLLTAKEQKK